MNVMGVARKVIRLQNVKNKKKEDNEFEESNEFDIQSLDDVNKSLEEEEVPAPAAPAAAAPATTTTFDEATRAMIEQQLTDYYARNGSLLTASDSEAIYQMSVRRAKNMQAQQQQQKNISAHTRSVPDERHACAPRQG